MRKGDGADGQRAKVVENFCTEGEGEGEERKSEADSVMWQLQL